MKNTLLKNSIIKPLSNAKESSLAPTIQYCPQPYPNRISLDLRLILIPVYRVTQSTALLAYNYLRKFSPSIRICTYVKFKFSFPSDQRSIFSSHRYTHIENVCLHVYVILHHSSPLYTNEVASMCACACGNLSHSLPCIVYGRDRLASPLSARK